MIQTISVSSCFIIILIQPFPAQSHFLWPITPCLLSDICNHTYVPACGEEERIDMHYRMFIDLCDMYEFNCDRNREYEPTEFSFCFRPAPMCPKHRMIHDITLGTQSTSTQSTNADITKGTEATKTTIETNTTNATNVTVDNTTTGNTDKFKRIGAFTFARKNRRAVYSQEEVTHPFYNSNARKPKAVPPPNLPPNMLKGKRRYTNEERVRTMRLGKAERMKKQKS